MPRAEVDLLRYFYCVNLNNWCRLMIINVCIGLRTHLYHPLREDFYIIYNVLFKMILCAY